MKRFVISTVLAGGLFAGLLGAAGAAHASEITPGVSSAPVRIFDADGDDTPNPYYDGYHYDAPHPYYDGYRYDAPDPYYGGHRYDAPHPYYDANAHINLPFGMGVGIGLDGARFEMPFGMGDASIGFDGMR